MILVEVTPAVDDVGTLATYGFGTEGFQTAPTDTPPDTVFDAALIEPGSIALNVFSDGRTGGATLLETGEIQIANVDGEYDPLIAFSFDGRPLTIRKGVGGPYPSAFQTIFTGTCAGAPETTLGTVVIRLKDKAAILDRPVLTDKFAGTNVADVGLEGTEADIKGQVKPRVYGQPRECSPAPANATIQIYRASDRALAAVNGVYDRGAALAFGVDHADSAALAAATIASGDYDTCLAEGLIRLGASPTGQVTCDPVEMATDETMTAGELLGRLAEDAGLLASEISASDIGELNAVAPYVLGLYLDDETTFREAMDQVMGSVGGWYAFDAEGVLRCGRLEEPAGETDAFLLEEEVLEGFERRTVDGDGVPAYRVSIGHSRFFTTQASDVAGSVDDLRRAELAQAYRYGDPAEDPAVKIQFSQAVELTFDTLLVSAADAATEAARRLALHKRRRDRFEVPLHVDILDTYPLPLMGTVTLTHSRFGLEGGKNFLILGRGLELASDRIVLQLWG